jgi:hypothetical protein
MARISSNWRFEGRIQGFFLVIWNLGRLVAA